MVIVCLGCERLVFDPGLRQASDLTTLLCLSVCLPVYLSLSLSLSLPPSLPLLPLSLPPSLSPSLSLSVSFSLSPSLPPPPPPPPSLSLSLSVRRRVSRGRCRHWMTLGQWTGTGGAHEITTLHIMSAEWSMGYRGRVGAGGILISHDTDRLVGLVVKASASRAEGPGFESRLRRDFFGVESYQWLKNWHSSGYPARRLAL